MSIPITLSEALYHTHSSVFEDLFSVYILLHLIWQLVNKLRWLLSSFCSVC